MTFEFLIDYNIRDETHFITLDSILLVFRRLDCRVWFGPSVMTTNIFLTDSHSLTVTILLHIHLSCKYIIYHHNHDFCQAQVQVQVG